ncbi:Z1 domain-containing protein [Rhodococcus aetherivorans]|uniref:Z1 domain-containing protein n=1 Tax=Rhodococcus aetherivorans TaxID=191292 RepID=UPI000622CE41|nr:Z1 domain-containing protein [Rhodococcus aetherivorans]AKE89441.1 endonuclease [Rhodococcus aetherivorans]
MTNKDELRITLHSAALTEMAATKPKKLQRALDYQTEDMPPEAEPLADERDFRDALNSAAPTDQIVELWRRQLTKWDFAQNPTWCPSEPRTDERRADMYKLLGLDESTIKLLDSLIPVSKTPGPVVISDTFVPWYKPELQQGQSWYWPAYRKLLVEGKKWPEEAVSSLDVASDEVVERLADPTRAEAYQSKGLVVGYVQSGKTANFTAVIAKAIDAGYRLVIVLGGTLNLLRAQTQRRIDMELVGRENIVRGGNEYESDYSDDPAWNQGKFLEFGDLPSAQGAFDIVRMTTRDDDYKSLLQGIVALEFEKREPALPLYDPRNLHKSSARLMVVKKNKAVLGKLVKDLRKIKTPLSEIPVLIIDDESDEASINTTNLYKPDTERTAINQKISDLLKMLPRAQYVGYTATPFANVFIDPSDAEDIFPKDFIVSLPRPHGYMGASDFHDLDSDVPLKDRNYANSNEKAYIRDIPAVDSYDDTYLQKAIDMFVLTGAMKLYREDVGGLGDRFFQHHTMLVHETGWTADHKELLGRITKLWFEGGYTSSEGHARLRTLFDTDVAPVSSVRAEGHAVPGSYDELMRYVGPATFRIGGDDKPIIVVNGDKYIETGEADFDKRAIWKILIGGQKLARGFTVEGLTVTFFRRRAGNASSLMQMGRWFGFRDGYRDLVRLFIGRGEQAGKERVDLYEAFEAICLDEESFRSELKWYSTKVDGAPQITPAQVPPVVSQHLEWLKPVSPNKMYNSRLAEIATPGVWTEPTAYPEKSEDLESNARLWLPVFDALSSEATRFACTDNKGRTRAMNAFTTIISPVEFLNLLEGLKWRAPSFAPHLAYLRAINREGNPQVDDWVVFAPQLASFDPDGCGDGNQIVLGSRERRFSYFERKRRRYPLFGAISDPVHRAVPTRVAGGLDSGGDEATESLVQKRRGAIVLYPIVEPDNKTAVRSDGSIDLKKLVMAFSFVPPSSARRDDGRVVRFTTIDSSREGTPIIDVQKAK